MVGNLLHWGVWRLPEIRSVAQSTSSVIQGVRTQRLYAVAVSAAGIGAVAVTFAVVGYIGHARRAADAQMAASRIEAANIDLQDDLSRLRDKVATSSRDLLAAQARVAALTEEMRARPPQHAEAEHPPAAADESAAAKADRVSQLTKSLHLAEAQRATLAARLSKAEADLAAEQAHQAEFQGALDQIQKKLQQLSIDRDKAINERDRFRARVGELEQKLSMAPQASRPVAAARPESPAPAATAAVAAAPVEAPQHIASVAGAPRVGSSAVSEFQRVLASAGVDVRHLFSEYGVNRGEGGPFVPVPRGGVPDAALSAEKLAALRTMMKTLPVSAPLEGYDISSPFGPRGDPEDGRAGFHTGIDLTAPYDSPVYATAPGIVTYAGYRDDYGKIVEIDHGNGIATRYAHLHAFAVSVGQRVGFHTQIGYLGSTGRATGPHVHYEVVVNGEPQDPEKFFGLARFVSATVPIAARN